MMNVAKNGFDWLAGLEFFGVKLGLHQTRMLFDELGAPDLKLRFIHLAGSNGKGSTGAMTPRCAGSVIPPVSIPRRTSSP